MSHSILKESRMRVERNLDDGTKMTWGFDHTAVGFFIEVRRHGSKTRCYDGLQASYALEHAIPRGEA